LGSNLYRLKVNHQGDKFEYSKVVTVVFEDPSVRQTLVFPNPVQDKIFIFENAFAPQNTVLITDMAGKVVRQSTVAACTNGLIVSDLAAGNYVLNIFGGRVPCQRQFVVVK
jgi:hypothetical protein